jgi:predicted hydrocarbon binding protein
MKIGNKTHHDLIADLYIPDAWMRWALLAAEETIGKLGLRVVLGKVGLERLIDNYPPYEQPKPSKNFTFGDYASLNAGLLDFCSPEGGSKVQSMGHMMVNHSTMEQGTLYGIGTTTFPKFLSTPARLKVSLEIIQDAARMASQPTGQIYHWVIDDRGDKLAYVLEECAFCAGKQSDTPMCTLLTGQLQEAVRWLIGKEFEINEIECRAMGASACVWEISKQPK